MKCECTIPKTFEGEEECHNPAVFAVTLIDEFDNETCFWCATCVDLFEDIVQEAAFKDGFANELKEYRQRNLLTQPELAKMLKTCKRSVSRWETRRFLPHPYMVTRFIDILVEENKREIS